MELFAETLSVVGALVLSVSCGLLLEELLFGGLVRFFFAPSRLRHRDASRKEIPARQQMEGDEQPASQGGSTQQ